MQFIHVTHWFSLYIVMHCCEKNVIKSLALLTKTNASFNNIVIAIVIDIVIVAITYNTHFDIHVDAFNYEICDVCNIS